jgi:hypothetical protein
MKARTKAKAAGLALAPNGKEEAIDRFYDQLRRDGVTATQLAIEAGVGRAYLTRVLNGHESGVHTWRKVLPLLSPAALFCVKQCSAWNIHAEQALAWVETLRAVHANIVDLEVDHQWRRVLLRTPRVA